MKENVKEQKSCTGRKDTNSGNAVSLVHTYTEKAKNAYQKLLKPEEAQEYFDKAFIWLEQAEEHSDSYYSAFEKLYLEAAQFYDIQGDEERASGLFQSAIRCFEALSEKSGVYFQGLARSCYFFGQYQERHGNIEQAEMLYKKDIDASEKWWDAAPAADIKSAEPGIAYCNIARFYEKCNYEAEAEEFYLRSIKFMEQLPKKNTALSRQEADAYTNIIKFYFQAKRYEDCIIYLEKNLALCNSLVKEEPSPENERCLAVCLSNAGTVYYEKNAINKRIKDRERGLCYDDQCFHLLRKNRNMSGADEREDFAMLGQIYSHFMETASEYFSGGYLFVACALCKQALEIAECIPYPFVREKYVSSCRENLDHAEQMIRARAVNNLSNKR
ncbi:tetratricopeptide repeat protein [Ruminococcus sp. 5_1_39BFAA]|uniref:tetratricopeptide repeat protein n=1 Tax=Ruminococcus sp. 5_1_39BFAA TaxID=457412 RepID=UPI0035676F1A